MFTRKLVIELSDESKEALHILDGEVLVLQELMAELVGEFAKMKARVEEEITLSIPDLREDGLQVFAEENGHVRVGELPETMTETEVSEVSINEADRIRESPFTRAPRSTQVDWLLEVMGDQSWYASVGLSREYAQDERHFRYLRHMLGHRMRELHEEGLLERRDSHVKGSMYEYRIRPE